MAQTKQSDKPAGVAFNADTFKREDVKDPFVVRRHGKSFTLADVNDVDLFRVANAADKAAQGDVQAAAAMMMLITPEDIQDEFIGESLPVALANAIAEAYQKHYGLLEPGKSSTSPRY